MNFYNKRCPPCDCQIYENCPHEDDRPTVKIVLDCIRDDTRHDERKCEVIIRKECIDEWNESCGVRTKCKTCNGTICRATYTCDEKIIVVDAVSDMLAQCEILLTEVNRLALPMQTVLEFPLLNGLNDKVNYLRSLLSTNQHAEENKEEPVELGGWRQIFKKVYQNVNTLRYVREQPPEIYSAAENQNVNALRYIREQQHLDAPDYVGAPPSDTNDSNNV